MRCKDCIHSCRGIYCNIPTQTRRKEKVKIKNNFCPKYEEIVEEKCDGCIGCKNIEDNNFPFITTNEVEGNRYFVDSELCGFVQNKEIGYLEIFYCPVCGRKL